MSFSVNTPSSAGHTGSGEFSPAVLELGRLAGGQDAMRAELHAVKDDARRMWTKLDEHAQLLARIDQKIDNLVGLPKALSDQINRCERRHAGESSDATRTRLRTIAAPTPSAPSAEHKAPLDMPIGVMLGEVVVAGLRWIAVGVVVALVVIGVTHAAGLAGHTTAAAAQPASAPAGAKP